MANHDADIKNPNKGTDGTNKTYDQNQGNRGGQMNPNNKGQSNNNSKPGTQGHKNK